MEHRTPLAPHTPAMPQGEAVPCPELMHSPGHRRGSRSAGWLKGWMQMWPSDLAAEIEAPAPLSLRGRGNTRPRLGQGQPGAEVGGSQARVSRHPKLNYLPACPTPSSWPREEPGTGIRFSRPLKGRRKSGCRCPCCTACDSGGGGGGQGPAWPRGPAVHCSGTWESWGSGRGRERAGPSD